VSVCRDVVTCSSPVPPLGDAHGLDDEDHHLAEKHHEEEEEAEGAVGPGSENRTSHWETSHTLWETSFKEAENVNTERRYTTTRVEVGAKNRNSFYLIGTSLGLFVGTTTRMTSLGVMKQKSQRVNGVCVLSRFNEGSAHLKAL